MLSAGTVRLASNWAPRELFGGEPVLPAEPLLPAPDVAGSLTLADLESMAVANNPTLAQAARQVQALRGKRLQVGLWPNPVLGYIGEEMGDEGTAGQQGAYFTQKIITADKLRLNRAVAGQGVEKGRQAYEIQLYRVLGDVRQRYYEVLVAQRTVELANRLVRIGEAGVQAAQDLLRAQQVSKLDLLQARVVANSAKVQLADAENLSRGAWRRLTAVLGTPDMEPASLVGDLEEEIPELVWDDALAKLLASSPELARSRVAVEQARCALARAQAGRVPDVNVQAAVRYNNASSDTVATIGVGMPLMLFNRNQGNILKAQAELVASQREVRRTELVLYDRMADAFQDYADARQQTRRYRDQILPDARETLDLTQTGYEQGEFGFLELLTSQRTYFRVNLAYLASLRNLWTGSVQIENLLLTDGLLAPVQ